MSQCLFCKSDRSQNTIILTNGETLHSRCYDNFLKRKDEHAQKISQYKDHVKVLQKDIKYSSTLLYGLKRFFGGESIDRAEREARLVSYQNKIETLLAAEEQLNKMLKAIYDYWPSYPPDWDDRKYEIKKIFTHCEKCDSSSKELHVHHIVSVSKGGSHSQSNLRVLCKQCHENYHGGREFSYDDNTTQSQFIKKLNLIRTAMSDQKLLHFNYTRQDGTRSARSINPRQFERFEESLCIKGYCYLRKEDRTFALKRMKQIEIVDSPKACYYQ